MPFYCKFRRKTLSKLAKMRLPAHWYKRVRGAWNRWARDAKDKHKNLIVQKSPSHFTPTSQPLNSQRNLGNSAGKKAPLILLEMRVQKAQQSPTIGLAVRLQWEPQLNLSGEKANLQVTLWRRSSHVVSCHYWPLYFMRKFLFKFSSDHRRAFCRSSQKRNYFLRRSLPVRRNTSASASGAIKLE